ncbi:hypothetical protein KM176_13120 [Pseudooceanicola sp. CBS1P-1]|uniref:Cellulose biosynthesis protein BcsS n=1 Tax=Pseudooceanicola albus TaxID=2692189 RepID=A0A6L7G3D6_9RHOB|nr:MULTISPECIES: hypothetical protein [Pseudooceanicola]MBT9384804.1 hypothetical protein [Pseudooceanicola endophyticus]MXN18202.1 hypothetical protein [Pseudooceanicola albus]
MKSLAAFSLLTLAAVAPGIASADEGLSFSGGATLASKYVGSSGTKYSNGVAFQPWVELGYNGAYVNLWTSNMQRAVAGNGQEYDLTLGYRGTTGTYDYNVGYVRYYYSDPSDNCCGEYFGEVSAPANQDLTLGVHVSYDPNSDVLDTRLMGDYTLTDRIGLGATFGRLSQDGATYGTVYGSYKINDAISLSATYHDSDETVPYGVFAVDYAF